MRNLSAITISLFILFTVSCEYSENGIYYHNVIPGNPPSITIKTNLDTMEAPSLIDSIMISYEIKVDSGEFIWSRFLLSDVLIFNSDTATNSFWLRYEMANDSGMQELTMEAYYSTNSGSIADVAGIEALKESIVYDIWFYEIN